MTPRFFARAISFLIAVPVRSIRGASRSALPSMDSDATASLFAMPVVGPAITALQPIFNIQFAPTPSAGHQALPCFLPAVDARHNPPDRKSSVWGKSVSVRVDLGVRRKHK